MTDQPSPNAQPQRLPVARTYNVAGSTPDFSYGICPQCGATVDLDSAAPLTDNSPFTCADCGANTPRLRLILEALARIDPMTWSLFASDVYIWDQVEMELGQVITYNVQQEVAKWQHYEVSPNNTSGERYVASLNFFDPNAFLVLADSRAGLEPPEDAPTRNVFWWRFGLSAIGRVPAWRQSLFGAATLFTTQPAAAVVLIAAGFEAFFNETMKIAWTERGLDQSAYEKLSGRNLAITATVDWLPAAVGRQPLGNAPDDLSTKWENDVNRRRNDVVHRAEVPLRGENLDHLGVAFQTKANRRLRIMIL